MSDQEVLFSRHGNTEVPITARLIARTIDPATAKRAAVKVTKIRVESSLFRFLDLLHNLGPLSCREAAERTDRADYWAVEWDKRVKAWAAENLIECVGERDGGRVWRVVTKEA